MKTLCILLCFALLFTAVGCTKPAEEILAPVNFYYPNSKITYGSADSVIRAEVREGQGHQEYPLFLLNMYLKGPISTGFQNPFPKGVTALSLTTAGTFSSVTVSDAFASLSGLELTMAGVCLAKTVMELTGAEDVMIRADTLPLGSDRVIGFSRETILLLDDSAFATQPQ